MENHDLRACLPKQIRLAAFAALALSGAACHMIPDPAGLVVFPEAHSRNLDELHRADGSYKYTGVLLGDFGYLIEAMRGSQRGDSIAPSQFASPSAETLENLVQLLSVDPGSSEARGLQLQWCARLAHGDASDVVREVAAEGLGRIALHLGLKEVVIRPEPSEAASAEDIAGLLEAFLRELRMQSEEGAGVEGFRAVCEKAIALELDLKGARRLHLVSIGLQGVEMNSNAKASLLALNKDLEVKLIEAGLFAAMADSSPRVALAGLKGIIMVNGPGKLVSLLSTPDAKLSDELQLGLLGLVRDHGLPEAGLSEDVRARCYTSILALVTDHRSARVRVHGMLALQKLAPEGPGSLREEDWLRWQGPVLGEAAEAP
jgi:hypothetical protein